ncbi:MAG: YihA family ribosome biogenesis GTP-binding protein [Proteobacteria bacterium]|nr:YihA family ribosome biogenesis GTP-binding protein [Pseudomonadota bacterium]
MPKPPSADSPAPRAPHPLVGAEFVDAAARPEQFPPAGPPEIAFAGRSNAGKSSAINALAARTRLAHTSRMPGRTQQIVFFRLRSGAYVADLPGYGYAAVPKALKEQWQDFLWSYVTTRPTLVALVLMIDARHGLKDSDDKLLQGFLPSGRPVLVLATKVDKLGTMERKRALASLDEGLREVAGGHYGMVTVIPFSATKREGVVEAEAVIDRWVGATPGPA